MIRIRCAILAGGNATRLGGISKGLLRIGADRILDRVVAAAAPVADGSTLLVTNAPEAAEWRPDLTVVADRFPGSGPLGGIATALIAAGGPVLCLAWDLPFLTAPLLARLAAGLEGTDACLPEGGGRRVVEPLCGAYGPGCLDPIRTSLAAGDRRAIGFHDAIRLAPVPLEEVRAYGDPARLFFNVNTAADLDTARRWVSASVGSDG